MGFLTRETVPGGRLVYFLGLLVKSASRPAKVPVIVVDELQVLASFGLCFFCSLGVNVCSL